MTDTTRLRVVFAGTPDFAAVALHALIQSEHDVVAVLTQPDRPAGRGRSLTASPVKALAVEHDIPVLQPVNFREPSSVDALRELNCDVMVVAAYGIILPQAVLDVPRHGCLNIHASLLPRWRGAAPIQRAILAGDTQSQVNLNPLANPKRALPTPINSTRLKRNLISMSLPFYCIAKFKHSMLGLLPLVNSMTCN